MPSHRIDPDTGAVFFTPTQEELEKADVKKRLKKLEEENKTFKKIFKLLGIDVDDLKAKGVI